MLLALHSINSDRFYTCRNQTGITTCITTGIKPASIDMVSPEGFKTLRGAVAKSPEFYIRGHNSIKIKGNKLHICDV